MDVPAALGCKSSLRGRRRVEGASVVLTVGEIGQRGDRMRPVVKRNGGRGQSSMTQSFGEGREGMEVRLSLRGG
jgi:hypothetical protein